MTRTVSCSPACLHHLMQCLGFDWSGSDFFVGAVVGKTLGCDVLYFRVVDTQEISFSPQKGTSTWVCPCDAPLARLNRTCPGGNLKFSSLHFSLSLCLSEASPTPAAKVIEIECQNLLSIIVH